VLGTGALVRPAIDRCSIRLMSLGEDDANQAAVIDDQRASFAAASLGEVSRLVAGSRGLTLDTRSTGQMISLIRVVARAFGATFFSAVSVRSPLSWPVASWLEKSSAARPGCKPCSASSTVMLSGARTGSGVITSATLIPDSAWRIRPPTSSDRAALKRNQPRKTDQTALRKLPETKKRNQTVGDEEERERHPDAGGDAGGSQPIPVRAQIKDCRIRPPSGWASSTFCSGLNLLPAFPLDGGRILQSLIWARTGIGCEPPASPPAIGWRSRSSSSPTV